MNFNKENVDNILAEVRERSSYPYRVCDFGFRNYAISLDDQGDSIDVYVYKNTSDWEIIYEEYYGYDHNDNVLRDIMINSAITETLRKIDKGEIE